MARAAPWEEEWRLARDDAPAGWAAREEAGVRARILVVDDEWDLIATYKRLLGRNGYGVVSATSREAGLAAIRSDPPHLVITDLRLPDGDGLEVVRAARATTVPTPVIVVTGLTSPRARQAALAAGASAFVVKPFASSSLTGIVRGILGLRAD